MDDGNTFDIAHTILNDLHQHSLDINAECSESTIHLALRIREIQMMLSDRLVPNHLKNY